MNCKTIPLKSVVKVVALFELSSNDQPNLETNEEVFLDKSLELNRSRFCETQRLQLLKKAFSQKKHPVGSSPFLPAITITTNNLGKNEENAYQ